MKKRQKGDFFMLKRIRKTYKHKYTKRRQKSVLDQGNCFLSESEDKKRRKRLSYFILSLAALLVIVPCLFLLKTRIEQNMFIDSEAEVLKDQKAVSMVMVFYKHQNGYVKYCQDQGVALVQYSQIFSSFFEVQQSFFDNYLRSKKGIGLEPSYARLNGKFSRVIDKAIIMNFDKMALDFTGYNKNNEPLTHKDVCVILDEYATDIIEKNAHPDYLRIREAYQLLSVDQN